MQKAEERLWVSWGKQLTEEEEEGSGKWVLRRKRKVEWMVVVVSEREKLGLGRKWSLLPLTKEENGKWGELLLVCLLVAG